MSVQATASANRFASGLHALVDQRDRSRLAALRRGLGRPVAIPGDAAREFYRLLPAGVSLQNERAYWIASTLFAAFPPGEGTALAQGVSVAAALRRLGEQQGGEDALARIERRVLQVLAARSSTIATHLRGAASLLHAGGIALDPGKLVTDLLFWGDPDRRVQQRWARDFWRVPEKTDETTQEEE